MSKHGKAWNIVLVMASVASSLLVIPPEVKAEMIVSRMQSGKMLELVRQELCSEIMQQQIQRFGLSPAEARQMQAVFNETRVLEQMVRLERQAAHTSKTVVIKPEQTDGLLTALESSVEKHMEADLRQKLSERAEGVFRDQRLVASRLSTSSNTVNARKALAQVRRALTTQKLVALGMTDKDARQTVGKLKDGDIERIFNGNLRIGYAAGIDWGSGPGLLLLLVIILGIAAIIAGGPTAVVFVVVALIALIYFLSYDEW
ncbi:MAG: hypothetical protein JSW66_14815 [Phycisphaerales bacterium]|nr:MAG: hypothetical protein JSW66_14815 [Phycisphaerales bacterium]